MTDTTAAADRGSVTPLIVGMLFCLLLLGAGVTAAGSAFLGRQHLQHLCDGAVADAADAAGAGGDSTLGADSAAASYLKIRAPGVAAAAEVSAAGVRLLCRGTVPITFGTLFGRPSLDVTVTAVGRPTFGLSTGG